MKSHIPSLENSMRPKQPKKNEEQTAQLRARGKNVPDTAVVVRPVMTVDSKTEGSPFQKFEASQIGARHRREVTKATVTNSATTFAHYHSFANLIARA